MSMFYRRYVRLSLGIPKHHAMKTYRWWRYSSTRS